MVVMILLAKRVCLPRSLGKDLLPRGVSFASAWSIGVNHGAVPLLLTRLAL